MSAACIAYRSIQQAVQYNIVISCARKTMPPRRKYEGKKKIPLNLIAGKEGSPPLFQHSFKHLGVDRTAAFLYTPRKPSSSRNLISSLGEKKPLLLVILFLAGCGVSGKPCIERRMVRVVPLSARRYRQSCRRQRRCRSRV